MSCKATHTVRCYVYKTQCLTSWEAALESMSRRLSSPCFRTSLRLRASQSSFHKFVLMVSSLIQFVAFSLLLQHHHNITAVGFTGPSIIHFNQLQFLSIEALELPLLPPFASFSYSPSSFSAQPPLASLPTKNQLPSRNHVSLLDIRRCGT